MSYHGLPYIISNLTKWTISTLKDFRIGSCIWAGDMVYKLTLGMKHPVRQPLAKHKRPTQKAHNATQYRSNSRFRGRQHFPSVPTWESWRLSQWELCLHRQNFSTMTKLGWILWEKSHGKLIQSGSASKSCRIHACCLATRSSEVPSLPSRDSLRTFLDPLPPSPRHALQLCQGEAGPPLPWVSWLNKFLLWLQGYANHPVWRLEKLISHKVAALQIRPT